MRTNFLTQVKKAIKRKKKVESATGQHLSGDTREKEEPRVPKTLEREGSPALALLGQALELSKVLQEAVGLARQARYNSLSRRVFYHLMRKNVWHG